MGQASTTVIGNLGRDAEFKDVGSTRVAVLSIPTDKGFGDRKVTTWWNVTVWGKNAERIENAFYSHNMYRKGDNVFAIGTPSVRTYEKKDGGTGFSTELDAFTADMVFASRNERDNGNSGGGDDSSEPIPF